MWGDASLWRLARLALFVSDADSGSRNLVPVHMYLCMYVCM